LKPQKKRTFSFRLPPPPQNTLLYHLTFSLITSNQGYDSFYSFNCESDAPQVLRSPEQEPLCAWAPTGAQEGEGG